jgi:hypothetical protein
MLGLRICEIRQNRSEKKRWPEMIGLHPAIDAIYRKNMRSGNIEEATAAWEKEMFDEKKVEEVA